MAVRISVHRAGAQKVLVARSESSWKKPSGKVPNLTQQELEPGAWTLAGFEDLTNLVFTHTTSQSQSPNQFHR